METPNNRGWLNNNIKAIAIIFLLFIFGLFVYCLFFYPEKIKEIKNIFTESKSLNSDSSDKKSEPDTSLEAKALNWFKKKETKPTNTLKEKPKKQPNKDEEGKFVLMYQLWNPDKTKRKLFYSRPERQKFANDHGLIFQDQGDSPIKVVGEGEFYFDFEGVVYKFKDFSSAKHVRSEMGLPITITKE